MKKTLLYFIILLTTNCFSLFSQTYVSGGLFNDTTWSMSGSPYIITSDVALFPGYTLIIEPGVTVKFDSRTKLILRGTLQAFGSAGSEITFTSNESNPVKGSWLGIEIENDQGGKILASNILGEYADNFIRIMNSSSGEVLNVKDSEIKNCNRAFYGYRNASNYTVVLDNLNVHDIKDYAFLFAQKTTLTNSIFSDGEIGIHNTDPNSNVNLSNCEFFNFSIHPFNLVDSVIDNCNIHDNEVGIKIRPGLIVKRSTIEFNEIGVLSDYPVNITDFDISDNKICDNLQYNFQHMYSYPITMTNNCWCSDVNNDIAETIYDAYDDVALGIVTFAPFDTSCISTLSTNDNLFNDKLYFYPNPANDEIFLSNSTEKKYEILSLNGQLIKEGVVFEKLKVSSLAKGIHLIKIYDKDYFLIEKLIKN